MLNFLGSLAKATVGVVIETPLAIAADFVTLGGSLTDKNEPYTSTAIKKIVKNVGDATAPTESSEDR